MTTPADMAEAITALLPNIKVGALRVYGDWFGRPYDAFHQVVAARATSDGSGLILEFDQGETLRIADPRGLSASHTQLVIDRAAAVRWEWFLYGKPMTEDNRRFVEHTRTRNEVVASTDFMPESIPFNPSVRMPAVEILDGWEHLPGGNPARLPN